MASITNDVAELESLVESLKVENRLLHNTKVQNEFELFELRRSNDKLQMERDDARESCSAMKLILDQAGAAIVHGMKAYHAANRERQEEILAGEEGKPLFLETSETVQ